MKMEVVLSAPGCFGNDGTPFKSEEVREWSRVDRLTGMLERARIETGRWRTSNDASAHSYGKVTDSRERNSADGCIAQKAKRQVEIFQSQEPGRSVQVFRASQWSSSRVTDGIVKSIIPNQLKDPMLNGMNNILKSDPWKFPTLTRPSADEISMDTCDNDMYQPINALLLKDTNSSEKYSLPKRSNSDEDLPSLIGSGGSSRISSLPFARDCKSRRSLQIPTNVSVSLSSHDGLRKNCANREIYSSTFPIASGIHASSVKIEDERKSSDYDSLRRKSPVVTSLPRAARSSPTTRPNAITVVNLVHPQSFQDNSRSKKSSIVTLRSSPVHSEESSKSRKLSLTKTSSSGDEGAVNLPGRAVKKVGFCKTEVHFAADSGKVNIVETDGKPPPTNKFRRRRRNQNQIGTSANLVGRSMECGGMNGNGRTTPRRMIVKSETGDNEQKITGIDNDNLGAYCVVDLESKKFWSNPEMNPRIHMTTVNFGKSDKRARDIEELKKPDELTSPKVVSDVLTRRNKASDCNIITTDSENNRVMSTIVTTHESTVARVEDNLINAKKFAEECRTKSPLSKKKNESKIVLSSEISDKVNKNQKNISSSNGLKETPVYVNVFKTPDDRYPIYENYRADTRGKLIPTGIKLSNVESSTIKATLEKKRSKAKSPNKLGKRSPVNLSRLSSLSRSNGKSQYDSTKAKDLKKSPITGEMIKSTAKSTPINIESKTKKPEHETGSTRSRRVPMEVVYRTAVFNMKNEKLSKPLKGKDTKATPRSINDLICGSKTSRTNNSKRKGSTSSQSSIKGVSPSKHWK